MGDQTTTYNFSAIVNEAMTLAQTAYAEENISLFETNDKGETTSSDPKTPLNIATYVIRNHTSDLTDNEHTALKERVVEHILDNCLYLKYEPLCIPISEYCD